MKRNIPHMPELPEVETVKIQLNDFLPGQTIENISILKDKSFIGNPKLILGAQVSKVERFAKILVISLVQKPSVAVHLKMTGQLIYRGQRQPRNLKLNDPLLSILPNKHTRVVISFSSGDYLFFNDLRRFGWIKIVENLDKLVKNLGPDPLKELTSERLGKILGSSSRPLKITLMDQEKIAGIGNIYANDALFLSGINPLKKSDSLSGNKVRLLFKNIRKVLKKGIKLGGASKTNFRDALGRKGTVQDHFLVYGKDGMACPNHCGSLIKKIKVGGRGTFYCPACQRL